MTSSAADSSRRWLRLRWPERCRLPWLRLSLSAVACSASAGRRSGRSRFSRAFSGRFSISADSVVSLTPSLGFSALRRPRAGRLALSASSLGTLRLRPSARPSVRASSLSDLFRSRLSGRRRPPRLPPRLCAGFFSGEAATAGASATSSALNRLKRRPNRPVFFGVATTTTGAAATGRGAAAAAWITACTAARSTGTGLVVGDGASTSRSEAIS